MSITAEALAPCSKCGEKSRIKIYRSINISEDEVLGVDTLKVTISVGVSEFNKNCDIPERLHQSADVALYEAKRRGRNRVVVYDESLE